MPDPLKDLHRKTFLQGQETVAKEVATELFEEQASLTQKAARIAAEMIDEADRIGADGDPFKRQIAVLVKGSVVESLAALQRVATGKVSVEEAKEALQKDPFTESSPTSASKLLGEPDPPKALPNMSIDKTQRRPRGRPRKNTPM